MGAARVLSTVARGNDHNDVSFIIGGVEDRGQQETEGVEFFWSLAKVVYMGLIVDGGDVGIVWCKRDNYHHQLYLLF